MSNNFKTEAELERLLESMEIPLADSKGNSYQIKADRLTWHWFLTITTDEDFPANGLMDDILEWHRAEHPNQEISYIFSAYVSHFVSSLGSNLKEQMLESMKTTSVEDHPFFKNIENTQNKQR